MSFVGYWLCFWVLQSFLKQSLSSYDKQLHYQTRHVADVVGSNQPDQFTIPNQTRRWYCNSSSKSLLCRIWVQMPLLQDSRYFSFISVQLEEMAVHCPSLFYINSQYLHNTFRSIVNFPMAWLSFMPLFTRRMNFKCGLSAFIEVGLQKTWHTIGL